jgi:hypothetical protein
VQITLPIFASDGTSQAITAERYVDEYQDNLYYYEKDNVKLDHVLSFAFPALVEVPRQVYACELELSTGDVIPAEPALDLSAIATADFQRRLPGILLKSVARALAKETARKEAKKEDETLGWIINAMNVATEQADTRGWILLPGQYFMLKTVVPPGSEVLKARFLAADGSVLEEFERAVLSTPGKVRFVTFRSFK